MRRRRSLVLNALVLGIVLSIIGAPVVAARHPGAAGPSGFRVLSGRGAAAFRLPPDVRLVGTWRDARAGLTYERYQQFQQPFDAHVEGAQLTVVRRAGEAVLVIGAHYPGLAPTNRLQFDGGRAAGRALASEIVRALPAEQRGRLESHTQLRIDPVSGRLVQRVAAFTDGVRIISRIDAETGAVLDSWDALAHESGMGTGVRRDRKPLLGEDPVDPADDLTRQQLGTWYMRSADLRLATYDARRSDRYDSGIGVMSDAQKATWANDNDWKAGYQRPAVDAQYYADLTDDWYRDAANVGGFDFVNTACVSPTGEPTAAPLGAIRSVVHFDPYPGGEGYSNAFWDSSSGGHIVYGDGDGASYGPFSGGQDVVSHELTHAVTTCRTPDLADNYRDQPGALNEALSDMMAIAMEWEFDEPLTSNCRRQSDQAACPDWWLGEDVILSGPDFGFRSMADPASAGHPSHWQNRCTTSAACTWDNGGVHINSTIPSHAFYLAVQGGRNARCSGPGDALKDCDVVVPAIGIDDAARLFFSAWAVLTENATFCDAHAATVASAEVLFSGSALHRAAAELAWAAVGRGPESCGASGGVTVAPRSLLLAPGGSGAFALTADPASVIDVTGPVGATFNVAPTVSGATVSVQLASDVADGTYPVTISVTDGTGTHVMSAALVVDGTPPTASVDSVDFASPGQISGTGSLLLVVDWHASDAQSGIANARLQSNPDNNGFVDAASGRGPTTILAGGSSYAFQVVATDAVGNAATSPASDPWIVGRSQEDAASYGGGTWSAQQATPSWGSVRYSTRAGAWASFTFSGTDVAWISTRGPDRGKARVYIDGVLVAKVDLYASAAQARRIVFAAGDLAAGEHTLGIRVVGTTGRPRVDVDGFVTLGQ